MARYALVPARFWDGLADEARTGMAVVISGKRIETIARADTLAADIRRFEWPDATLIPGLMDAHVHYSDVMGPAFLAAGVTTIRDVGNDLEWILAQRERHATDLAAGPAILCCGHLLDGPVAHWPHMGRPHASPEALRAAVRHHIDRGVNAVKLYAGITPDLMAAGIDEAHRRHTFVIAHLGATKAEEAIRAGLDEFEHLDGCGVAWRAATPEEDDAMIDLMLEHHVVINPTFVVWDRLGRILDRSFHHDERRIWAHPCHLALWDRYLSRFGAPEARWRLQEVMVHLKRFLRRAHRRGVTVALGTDTPFPHLVPGMSVHDELSMYTDAGLSPVEALRSATSVNAKVLGIEKKTGTLQPGFFADMVVIRGNPLDRIDDVGQVLCTIRAGRRFTPDRLLRKLKTTFDRKPLGAVTQDLQDYVDGKRPS